MVGDPVLLNDWHVVARSADVESGRILPVRLLGEDLILWRCGNEILAWQDLCIHRGARLSLGRVQDSTLECPYHGWVYDRTGRCVRIPAQPDRLPPTKAAVKAYHAQERYGLVWVCLGEPSHPIPDFPEWDDGTYRKVMSGPYKYKASGPRAIENFLDVAHFPFVHEGILGARTRPEIEDYEVEMTPDGPVARDVRVYQPDPFGVGTGTVVSYTYRVLRPLTAYLAKTHGTDRFAIFFTVQPVEELESVAWVWMALNYDWKTPDEQFQVWQDRITHQDVPVVESQRPERLPLDLQAELHLRSDRMAIAYRRWLRELGLSFGTA